MAAAADHRHVCRTVGITASMDIATVLREPCSWARRSARYASIVQQGQYLNTAMVNLLQQNAQMISQRVTADLDARYGLSLSEWEAAEGDYSSSGEYPSKRRVPLAGAGPIGAVGSSGVPSPGFAPAGSNEDDGVFLRLPPESCWCSERFREP
ncbi:unnamed protein product [Agarophyton chilense]